MSTMNDLYYMIQNERNPSNKARRIITIENVEDPGCSGARSGQKKKPILTIVEFSQKHENCRRITMRGRALSGRLDGPACRPGA